MAEGIDINLDDEVNDVELNDEPIDEQQEGAEGDNQEGLDGGEDDEPIDPNEGEEGGEGNEGEPQEPQEPAKPNPVKQLRDALKEEKRARLALEAELRRAKEQTSTVQEIELPPEPTLEDEDVDFDPEKFKAKTQQWLYTKLQVEQQQKARQQQAVKQQELYNAKLLAYQDQVKDLVASKGVKDYAEAEDTIKSVLDVNKQSILISYIDNKAELVYALYRSPQTLYNLSNIQDPFEFQKELLEIERRVKAKMGDYKKPPAPEKVLGGGAKPSTSSAGYQKQLDALRDKGDITGSIKLKRELKAKGIKVE